MAITLRERAVRRTVARPDVLAGSLDERLSSRRQIATAVPCGLGVQMIFEIDVLHMSAGRLVDLHSGATFRPSRR
jgi:hypothetical protein